MLIADMREVSKLTYKIAGLSEIQFLDSDEFIDWACEMLELGYESESLFMLASVQKPTNFYESSPLVKSAFGELGLILRTGRDAVLSYSYMFVKDLACGKETKRNLAELAKFCIRMHYQKDIFSFYLLHFELEDIQENVVCGNYWKTATPENIQATIRIVAKEWIEKYRENYAQYGV